MPGCIHEGRGLRLPCHDRKDVACVAGGIVSAREIKFWRRSRQASGEAARRMGSRQNFISRAPTIPPAMQAKDEVLIIKTPEVFSHIHLHGLGLSSSLILKKYLYASLC